MSTLRHTDSHIFSLFHWRTALWMLALLYAAAFIDSPATHPHSHHHHVADHDSCGTDPCHITLYHRGHEGGCQHPFHLTSAEPECALCHMDPVRHIVPELTAVKSIVFHKPAAHYFFQPLAGIPVSISHDDRGPPMNS